VFTHQHFREPWRAEMLMREHVSSVKTSLIKALAKRRGDHNDAAEPTGGK